MVNVNNALKYGNKVGKFLAVYNFVILLIFCIGFFLIGNMMRLSHNDKLSGTTSANIINSNCVYKANRSKNSTSYECDNIEYTYTVDGKTYINNTQSNSNVDYRIGQTIKIAYNPLNPIESDLKQLSPKLLGNIFIGISIFMFILGLVQLLSVFYVKGAGSVHVIGSIYSYFTND